MKAYKGFNNDMTCRNFKYEAGKTYEFDGEVKLCSAGFHACKNPFECFSFYAPANSEYHEVELEDVSPERGEGTKVVAKKITIGAKINLFNLVQAGVKYIKSKINWDGAKETTTGYYSAATNTGDCSAATNTGDHSAATNTGDHSAATNTGDHSAATNTGYCSAATTTGYCSAATNTGYYSAATNTGYYSAATNTGDCSAATNTGDHSAATNTGDCSAATNTGDCSAAEVSGKDSIAVVTGKDSKARGALGCWLVLTERNDKYDVVEVRAVKVDGENVKPDTWYKLENGEIKET